MTGKTRILVVDDNRQIQALLTELLGVAGHVTRAAASCEEARALIDQEAFSCALIDLGLPDGNGLELLPYIRERQPLLVPVILTGDDAAEETISHASTLAQPTPPLPIDRAGASQHA